MYATDLHLFESIQGRIDLTPFYQALPYSDTEKLLYKIIVTQNANASAPCSDKEFFEKAQLCVQKGAALAAVKKFVKDMRVFDVGGKRYIAVVDDFFVKPKDNIQDNTSTDAVAAVREIIDADNDTSLFRALKDYIKLLQSADIKIDVVKLRHEILRNLRNIGKPGLTDLVTDALLSNNYELFPAAIILTDDVSSEEILYTKLVKERDEARGKAAELLERLQSVTDKAIQASQAFAAADKEHTSLIAQLTGQISSMHAMNDTLTAELSNVNEHLRTGHEKYNVLRGRYNKAVDDYKKFKAEFDEKVEAFNAQANELEVLAADNDRLLGQLNAYKSFIENAALRLDPSQFLNEETE